MYKLKISRTKKWIWKAKITIWEPEYVFWYRKKQETIYSEYKELSFDRLFEKIYKFESDKNFKF